MKFPIWIDSDQAYGRVYTALGLPTTVVVGRDGIVSGGYDGELTYANAGCGGALARPSAVSSTALLAAVLALAAISSWPCPAAPSFRPDGTRRSCSPSSSSRSLAPAANTAGRRRPADARASSSTFAAAILGLAIVANALFAPEPRTVIAAPGQHVAIQRWPARVPALAERRGEFGAPGTCAGGDGEGAHYAGSFVLRAISRNAVAVAAANGRGERLTVTQPSGAAFLSPVLLMQQTQSIAGMDVRYDSFAAGRQPAGARGAL